jgi:hypothetical protein
MGKQTIVGGGKQVYHFEFSTVDGVVNAEDGVIEGVSVITGGVQAKGHNLEVDATTLEQMRSLGAEKGQVPVKWNHKSGADAVNGFLQNFRIKGMKLLADWHLLKTHPQYGQALELATRMPKNVGLSASFVGKNEKKGGKEFARCEDLISVDLVATPAANPDGMFEARVDNPGEDMADKLIPGDSPETTQDAATILLGEFRHFAANVNTRLIALETPEPDPAAPSEDEDDDEDEGAEGEEGEGAAGDEDGAEAGAPAGFQNIGQVLQYFEARLDAAASARERQEFESAQHTLEDRVGELLDVNEQLLGENALLAEAYQELSAKTKNVVEFSAGTDGTPRPTVRATDGRQLTRFEQRVEALKQGGKSPADAMIFAVEEDFDRYTQHLEAKGAFAQRL